MTHIDETLEELEGFLSRWARMRGNGDEIHTVEGTHTLTVSGLTALREEIERLRGALEFYAEKQNYVDGPSISDSVYCPYYPILDDRGDRARKVLGDQNAD